MMKTRMQPIEVIANKVPRIVRDIAVGLGKGIRVALSGMETELDRALIEAVRDPLLHVIRNSCDHGLERPEDRRAAGKPEEGVNSIKACHEGGKVVIDISDDGRGMDPSRLKARAVERGILSADDARIMSDREAIGLIFLPGFSTAEQVTNISGRGVGMDVVKTNIERIGGAIDIHSTLGVGTTVRMRIPLTLAIVPGLVVSSAGRRFVIPQANLHEVIWIEGGRDSRRIEYVHRAPVLRLRDELLPLYHLRQVLDLPGEDQSSDFSIAVVHSDGFHYGLVVDAVSDTEEIVVKPLGPLLEGAGCYAGATIMGDGGIALIIDVAGVAAHTGAASRVTRPSQTRSTKSAESSNGNSILLVRSGEYRRLAIALGEVARLEQMPLDSVERASGEDVVQYRGRILPLVSVARRLGTSTPDPSPQGTLEVVVCRHNDQMVGLVVDEVIDAIEESFETPTGSTSAALLGSAVVGGLVTDFLDLSALVSGAAAWSAHAGGVL